MVDSSVPVWTPKQGSLALAGVPEGKEPTVAQGVSAGLLQESLERHLRANKGLAYYRNEDLGHPQIGDVVALTFGTPEAQFPDDPPKRMPDGLMPERTGGINWRYQLVAVTFPFPAISEPDDSTPAQSQVWVSLDLNSGEPSIMDKVSALLNGADFVTGWYVINPANDEFNAEYERQRATLKDLESSAATETLPFEEDSNGQGS